MLGTALLSALLLVAAPDEVVTQASIQEIGPVMGTRGTEIVVTGESFGEKRPRAWLIEQATGKSRRQRVTSWSDTEVVVQVRSGKLPAGPYTLRVDPATKAKLPLEAPDSFEVCAPRIDFYEPTWIADQGELTLVGEHFGSLGKPRVTIGGKRTRVLEASDDRLLVKRRKQITGDATVTVKTAAGISEGPCPFYVHGDSCASAAGVPTPKLPCPLNAASAVYLEVDGWPHWSVDNQLEVELQLQPEDPALSPRMVVKVGGLTDPSGYKAAVWLTFELGEDADLTPLLDATLIEARYAVFVSPTITRTWLGKGLGPNVLKSEWSSKHCFSFSHAVADLAAVNFETPPLIRVDAVLRLDTMALLSD